LKKIANFEIPASEIEAWIASGDGAKLASHLQGLDEAPADFPIEDSDHIFPATFLIEAIAIRAWALHNKLPIESLYAWNSEASSDDKLYPKFGELLSAWWGFGEPDEGEIPNVVFAELDDTFKYSWDAQAMTHYEITINGKKALAIDCFDGTSGTTFSQVTFIFQK
jgi:hypothetical protein